MHTSTKEYRPMPDYTYQCKDCKKMYTVFLWISDHDSYQPECPSCGSKACEQEIGIAGVVTEKLPNIQLP
jgi:putative FmdB family regulatory protein